MKLLCTCLVLAALVAGAGCGKKEITSIQRKQAATLVSEADFALTVRDYTRAEGLLVQATTLCPDTGEYWIALGSTRVKAGQRDSAKNAYKQALGAFEKAARERKDDAEPMLQQIYVLALLGRVDDSRALQEKLPARHPNNRDARAFIDSKQLDRMLADPKFKEIAL